MYETDADEIRKLRDRVEHLERVAGRVAELLESISEEDVREFEETMAYAYVALFIRQARATLATAAIR